MFEQYKDVVYQNKNNIEYLQFKKLLELGINHAYTLKGQNINFRVNNQYEIDSYNKIFSALNLDINTKVKPIQKHSCNIRCIDEDFSNENLENVDGLITNKKGITLVTTNADCILLLFYDPVKKVIANVHSGWRGTIQKIAEKTVVKMINCYKCNPKDIMCFICPSIRKCHFEVDLEVKNLFEEVFDFTNRTKDFIAEGEIKDNNRKYLIDTVLINKILLMDLGMLEKNIIDSGICSFCNNEKISSYRAEGKDYNLATAIISL